MMRRVLLALACIVTVLGGLLAGGTLSSPSAAATPGCPDVHLLFARGTVETAPPVGVTGLAFGRALQDRLPHKSVRVEGLNYAASAAFNHKRDFVESFVAGIRTAQHRLTSIAATCPKTRIVFGGYSQGAALVGYALSSGYTIPAEYHRYREHLPGPLPVDVANHVAAVIEFGPPSARFLRDAGAPPIEPQATYRARTARYCAPRDTICDGAPLGGPDALHLLYPVNGMTEQAAGYVAGRL